MADKTEKIKLSTKPYKGTRDFYPEDMRLRDWLNHKLSGVAASFGYEPYDGPMLESFDLYAAKTGEEIVNKQLYHFVDQGDRKVAIRPEMTPTLARLVAARARELPKPIRFYAFPNLWRYEQPGRGRLREHWQFNVDVLGPSTLHSEVEILALAMELLLVFEPPKDSFVLRLSHRGLLDGLIRELGLAEDAGYAFSKVLDKREKISKEDFHSLLSKDAGLNEGQIEKVEAFLVSSVDSIADILPDNEGVKILQAVSKALTELGYGSYLKFDPSIVRGFDYYSGTVFEIHDNHPDNNRSLFGGGRYDNLVGLFGGDSISGFGFGMGDVTLINFLTTHGLLPELKKPARVYGTIFNDELALPMQRVAMNLRRAGIDVETTLKADKMGKQFKQADAKGMDFVLLIGEDENKQNLVTVKNMKSGDQEQVKETDLADYLQKSLANL